MGNSDDNSGGGAVVAETATPRSSGGSVFATEAPAPTEQPATPPTTAPATPPESAYSGAITPIDENSALGLDSTRMGSVGIGSPVSAELYSLAEAHDWTFEGEEGQVITIRCEAAPGEDTDPRINLLAPNGVAIAMDDDSGNGYNSIIRSFRLPVTGTYIVKVDIFTEGEYILSIDAGGSRGSGGSLGSSGGAITPIEENSALGLDSTRMGNVGIGSPVSAELDTIFEAHDWTFAGEEGQVITIRCEAAPGEDTDPRINLLAPDGTAIAMDDDSGNGYNSAIRNFRLPVTGAYTIKVDIFTAGEYILSVDQ
jgi:hypothetical protein